MQVKKIVSGGQTGIDRAALDAAIASEMPHGGWIPAGRWAEDGPISSKYHMVETPSSDTKQRTEWNVRDSDATLIITSSSASPGTLLTEEMAIRYERPHLVIFIDDIEKIDILDKLVRPWLSNLEGSVLNIAGPRESECALCYERALKFISSIISSTR